MPQYVSGTGKLLSVVSLLAVTSLVPQAAWSQTQYVTDWEKKPAAKTSTATTTNVTTTTKKGDTKVTTTTTTTTATGTPAAPKAKIVVIAKPTKHVSTAAKWQQFADYIILKPGQESLPLTLNVYNGPEGSKPMRAIRATLSGRELFTEKSFKGKETLALDLSDALTPGSTQIVFQTYGDVGATFTWDLTSKSSPSIKELNPKSATIGASVKATGKQLPTDVRAYTITVGGKAATVSTAGGDAVEFKVPDGIKPDAKGEVPVLVTVSGQKFKALMLKVVSEPEIQSFSHVSISSQQVMTITGKNFGKDAAKVKVTFGGIPGDIMSCSDNSITVRTPEITEIPSTREVLVTVDGVKCKKAGTLFFSMRNVENNDGYSPFGVPNQFQ